MTRYGLGETRLEVFFSLGVQFPIFFALYLTFYEADGYYEIYKPLPFIL
jgi:hypothetical protein